VPLNCGYRYLTLHRSSTGLHCVNPNPRRAEWPPGDLLR